jgi:arylformamidase
MPVFLDYDQAALDDAYDQSVHAPNMAQVLQRYASSSAAARARIGEPARHAYGPTPVEGLDFFASRAPNAPILVFLHGGAWRAGVARNYAFLAGAFLAAGAHVAIPDFIPVQEAGGDLRVMVDQARRAVAWVQRHAARLGGDPSRLYLAGHSSGAHLAGMCLLTDWKALDVPAGAIRGCLCSSGIYDLKPIRLSERNAYVRLDDAAEEALSVQRHAAKLRVPLLVSHGTRESPEFVRQAREFAALVNVVGGRADLVVGEDYNHFEILETLGNPHGALGHAMLRLMELA